MLEQETVIRRNKMRVPWRRLITLVTKSFSSVTAIARFEGFIFRGCRVASGINRVMPDIHHFVIANKGLALPDFLTPEGPSILSPFLYSSSEWYRG